MSHAQIFRSLLFRSWLQANPKTLGHEVLCYTHYLPSGSYIHSSADPTYFFFLYCQSAPTLVSWPWCKPSGSHRYCPVFWDITVFYCYLWVTTLTCLFPTYLSFLVNGFFPSPLQRVILSSVGWRIRYRRTHISHMRTDQMQKLVHKYAPPSSWIPFLHWLTPNTTLLPRSISDPYTTRLATPLSYPGFTSAV